MRSIDELLLFFPTRFPDGDWHPAGLDFEDAWPQTEDGVRIHGWYCPCDNPRAVLLYAHGNGGCIGFLGPFLAYLQSRRLTVLAFDYRGYGRSDGTPTVAGVLSDARAARQFLCARMGIGSQDVVLMGRSLGGAVMAQIASEQPPRGLILESTFSSMREVAAVHYSALSWLVPAAKLNSLACLADYRGPLLQSHGDADQIIPFSLGTKLFDAAQRASPKTFFAIKGGDHNDPQPAEYYRELDRFIDELPHPQTDLGPG